MSGLPSNVHVSSHPVVQAKVSQLRQALPAKETRQLIGEISSLLAGWVGAEAFKIEAGPKATSAAGVEFTTSVTTPSSYTLIPILRSGLGMVEAFSDLLPSSEVPVYHLGLYREKLTLSPVEYYNKLPKVPYHTAFVLDPLIATGATAEAVVATLKDWGVKKIYFIAIVATKQGVSRLLEEYQSDVADGSIELYVGQLDETLSNTGFILPGVGDIGDRLHSTSH